MLRALALILGVAAVGCMVAAVVGMVTGRPGDRIGWALRSIAVACFAGAVVLGSLSH